MAMCEKCKSNNLIETENGHYCCNCGWDSVKKDYIKRMTNADRIRSMTDEELAEFISKYFSCEYECAVRDKCGSDWDCKRATIDWLQSEVEGVTENE